MGVLSTWALAGVLGAWAVQAFVAPVARAPTALCAKKESLSVIMEDFKQRQWKKENLAPRPIFAPGDTVKVGCEIVEGKTTRVQAYEGVVISRSGAELCRFHITGPLVGFEETFTVRKLSAGQIGVERIFPVYAPLIKYIEVTRRGSVRRAKLYYLRNLYGKAARLGTKVRGLNFLAAAEKAQKEAAIAETVAFEAAEAEAKATAEAEAAAAEVAEAKEAAAAAKEKAAEEKKDAEAIAATEAAAAKEAA